MEDFPLHVPLPLPINIKNSRSLSSGIFIHPKEQFVICIREGSILSIHFSLLPSGRIGKLRGIRKRVAAGIASVLFWQTDVISRQKLDGWTHFQGPEIILVMEAAIGRLQEDTMHQRLYRSDQAI
jgi:hypothetical protein